MRAAKSNAKLTALKLVNSKQQPDSDDDIDDDSCKNHTLARMWIQMIPMMTMIFLFYLSDRKMTR
jgi:hypothetical protein